MDNLKMNILPGKLIKKITLSLVEEIIKETNIRDCKRINKNGFDSLEVDLTNTNYLVTIDEEVLTFMTEVTSHKTGNIEFSNEWNMFETMGTVICLNTGYVMKFGVLISGGIVRETLRDAIFEFNDNALKFSKQAQMNNQ